MLRAPSINSLRRPALLLNFNNYNRLRYYFAKRNAYDTAVAYAYDGGCSGHQTICRRRFVALSSLAQTTISRRDHPNENQCDAIAFSIPTRCKNGKISEAVTSTTAASSSVELERLLKNAARKADLKTIRAALRSSGKTNDVSLHQKILSALSWRGHARQCVKWLGFMEEEWGLIVDAACFTAVVNAFASRGDLMAAEKYFRCIHDSNRDVVLYGAVIKACIQAKNLPRAEFYFNQMRERGVTPNGHVYSQIISFFARSADSDTAVTWLTRMLDEGASSKQQLPLEQYTFAFNSVINAFAQQRDVTGALFWLNRMEEMNLNVDKYGYTSVISACADRGKAKTAARLFEKMQVCSNITPDKVTYTALITACARARDPIGAEKYFGAMVQQGIRAGVEHYTTVLAAHAWKGDVHSAERWLQKMSSADIHPTTATYNLLLDACSSNSSSSNAPSSGRSCTNQFYRMARVGVPADTVTFTSIIDAFSKAGDVASAVEWLRKTPRPDAYTFSAALKGCANCKDTVTAKSVVAMAVRHKRQAQHLKSCQHFDLPAVLAYAAVNFVSALASLA